MAFLDVKPARGCGWRDHTPSFAPRDPYPRRRHPGHCRQQLCRCPSPPCPFHSLQRRLRPVARPAEGLHVRQLVRAAIRQRDDVVQLPAMPLHPHRPAKGTDIARIVRPWRDGVGPAEPPRHRAAAGADAAIPLAHPLLGMAGPAQLVGLDTGRVPVAPPVRPAVRPQDQKPAPAAGAAWRCRMRNHEPAAPDRPTLRVRRGFHADGGRRGAQVIVHARAARCEG